MFAVVGDLANAYNTIEWKDAVPFLAIIIGLYWVCLLYTSPSPRD